MAALSFSDVLKARQSPESHEDAVAFAFSVPIVKSSGDDQRLLWGWAAISTFGGQPVVDIQGDVIPVAELEQAAHHFIEKSRVGKRQHAGAPCLSCVESVVFTKERQDALGIDLGCEGWFTGWRVNDDAVWADAKAGLLPALSIGGSAVRIPLGATP